jgi:acetyltransferase-like isoleucine patch superfamily enzyme
MVYKGADFMMPIIEYIEKIYIWLGIKRLINNGLKIGKDTDIFTSPSNFGSEPYLIKIGDHCTIAADVRFITHDGGTRVFRFNTGYGNLNKYGKIEIKDNCMIGIGSIILPNVTIGPNTVIGAGSVVTRDIPHDVCACGNPAKAMCSLDEYIEKTKKQTVEFPIIFKSKREVLERYFWGEK